MTTVRSYDGPADLRAMQELARRIWSPSSHCHVGDLAWQRNQHVGREPEWPTALWFDGDEVGGEVGGEVVAWGWCELPGDLVPLVDPAREELADEVLTWFEGVADPAAGTRTVHVLDRERHVVAALERHGYTREDTDHYPVYLSRRLDDLRKPVLPSGFAVHAVGPADVARRAAAHRAAWHPSRVTEESYRNVMAAWPYRADLDRVVVAPDGRFAAYCLAWLDERNGVGELEPVGTDPEFRRMGLATAVCLDAMHSLRDAGATQAVVYPVRNHPNGAEALYENLGFTQYAHGTRWVRRAPTGS